MQMTTKVGQTIQLVGFVPSVQRNLYLVFLLVVRRVSTSFDFQVV